MKRLGILLVLSMMVQGGEGSLYTQQAEKVMNRFLSLLQHDSYEISARKVVPLMHRSLLDRSGKRLDDDTLRFSFKKAHQNAQHYAYPVQITRVQKLRTTGVGHGRTYQKGVEYKYWIRKRKGEIGMPAPLVLFFPRGEAVQPKLSYVGSL